MALGLVLNVVQITLDYSNAQTSMEEEVQAVLDISVTPASQIAYNIDIRLAEELLGGLLRHPAIIDARMIDHDDRTMASAGKSSANASYRWVSDLLFGSSRKFDRELRVAQLEDLLLGRLIVTIDTYQYGLQFLERASYTLVSGLIKSLVLSAALLGIFYLVLTRPMLNVIKALEKVNANKPEKVRLPIPNDHREDEIGTMIGIINQHLEVIDVNLAQLRMAESAMKDYSGQLEREVEDRTREISEKSEALRRGNQALIKAKEDAVHRAKSRANFLASMSHEIRTPLNGLLGMLGLALEGNLDADQRRRLDIAFNAGENLLGLLNDILDISKVESGKLSLEHIPFSVRRLVEECVTLHTQQADKKHIDLIIETEAALPEMFLGDPTRTRQILNNLLSNAIKFTNEGSVRILTTYPAGNVQISVIDTGIGMSDKSMRRIFLPFSQADAEITRLYGGTGLGLALCRQLVDRMHGKIQVESTPGEGSRFTVTLPFAVQKSDQSIARAAFTTGEQSGQTAAEADHQTLPQSLQILLVEDNQVNQLVATGLLKNLGHQVDCAENGAEALKALSERNYDLVLMDCQMPVMNGYETTRRIRANEAWKDLPIIAVTANVMQGDRDDCLAFGMNDYITKPFSREQLQAVIKCWAPRNSRS
jgi:signal transduction histidine kinase/ActR/RegA family two-component response regulator